MLFADFSTKAGRKAVDRLPRLAGVELACERVLSLLGLAPPGCDQHQDSQQPLAAEALARQLGELRRLALVRAGMSEADVAERLAARAAARAAKDFKAGDAVRDELAARGVMIMDTPEGSTWRPGVPAVSS